MKFRPIVHLALIAVLAGFFALPPTAEAARRSRRSSISSDPGGHTNRGVKYARAKKYDKAIEEFTKAIKRQPKDPKNYSNRALSYQLSGKLAEAKADYTKAIELKPDSDDYTRRARIELKQNKVGAALKDLDKALELSPKDTGARRLRAYTHLQKKDWEKAIADYDEIIKRSKKADVEALERRGFAYRNLKKYELAAEDFTKVIENKKKDIEAYRRRVYVYRVMKQNDKAMADLRQILKIKPDDADAKAQLAILEKAAPTPAAPKAKPQASPVKSAQLAPKPAKP